MSICFQTSVPIGGDGRDRLTRQGGEELLGLFFKFSSASSRSHALQAEQNLAADSGTDDHLVIGIDESQDATRASVLIRALIALVSRR